jgi:hypothetical protein
METVTKIDDNTVSIIKTVETIVDLGSIRNEIAQLTAIKNQLTSELVVLTDELIEQIIQQNIALGIPEDVVISTINVAIERNASLQSLIDENDQSISALQAQLDSYSNL